MNIRQERDAAGIAFKTTYPLNELPFTGDQRKTIIKLMVKNQIDQTPTDSRSTREIRLMAGQEVTLRLRPPVIQAIKRQPDSEMAKDIINNFAGQALTADEIVVRQQPEYE